MEVPEAVRLGLASIKPTLHVRWNPTARVLKGWSFDAAGRPRGVSHDPRWELWDTDAFGTEYRITTVEKDGQFVPVGEWLVELMNFMNPARYDGDLHRMIDAMVDRPNRDVERIGSQQYEELVDYLADLATSEASRGSRVAVSDNLNRV